MKKLFTLILMAGLSLMANAQADGFYHVKNTYTNRYIYINDDSKGTSSVTAGIDARAIRSSRNKETIYTHPGAVVYISAKGGGKYDVAAQGTSFGQLTGGELYPQFERQADGTYRFHGVYEGMDYTVGDLSRDREEGMMLEVTKGAKNSFWQLLPIDNKADGEFIGIKPEVQTADGTWWASFFAEFAFDLHSTGMKAFYVDTANDTEFTLKEITGTIPANTPVLIQCASEDYTKNIVRPLTSGGSNLTDNKLKGVFFDSSYNFHIRRTTYDKNTMRVIGINENKALVFKIAGEEDLTDGAYLRHNKAYLEVSSGSAETLYVKGSNTFTAKTTEGIDMVFTILDEGAKTCQVGYIDGSSSNIAVERNAVEGHVTIPEIANGYTVVEIGKYAFSRCSDLTSITIPTSVTSIQLGAFSSTGLTSISLPSSLKRIESDAFAYTNLTSITIPASVEYIGGFILRACSKLTQITVEAKNTTYDSRDNCNAIIENTNTLIQGCNTTTIPTSVTVIGSRAFQECFDLTSITIPASVTSIEGYAFYYCNNLTSVTVEAKTPPDIKSNSFTNRANATLRVPAGSKDAYASATWWRDFGTIQEIVESKVKLSKTKATIEKGKTLTLKSKVYPTTVDQSVTWESSDPKIAKVSSTGKVTGIRTGTAKITCTSLATGQIATCEVTVGYVKLSKSDVTIQKGKAVTLTTTVYPTTEDQSVTWESSDPKIAKVSSTGKVTGIRTGTATITCTSLATGQIATCEVTVGYVKLSKSDVTIQKGKAVTLTTTVYPTTEEDQSVTWKSSDPKIAKVSSTGKVTGVRTGTATITCTSNATGLSATCEVTVGQVKLSKTEVTIQKGKAVTLKATVYPTTLEDQSVTWESSNTKIATVSSSGKVKGVRTGTAKITCTSNATGLSATCTVTVTAGANSRSLGGGDDDATSIDDMDVDPAVVEPFDVYDLSGHKVRHQATSLDGLPNGIYIVNSRKVLKK